MTLHEHTKHEKLGRLALTYHTPEELPDLTMMLKRLRKSYDNASEVRILGAAAEIAVDHGMTPHELIFVYYVQMLRSREKRRRGY